MRSLMLALLAAVLLAAPAAGQQWRDPPAGHEVVVRNDSQQRIDKLFASRSQDDRWGLDRLHGASIAPGQSWPLRLGAAACSFDFQAAYQDGRVEERRGVDVCRNPMVAFDGTRARMPEESQGQGQGQPPAPPQSGGTHPMVVVNGEQIDIVSIYVSPTNQSEWGDDRLGDDKLPAGRRFNLDVSGGCKQDLRVVFDNKSAEEKREIDICAQNIINIHPGWTTEAGSGGGSGGGGGGGGGGAPEGGEHNRIRYLEPAH